MGFAPTLSAAIATFTALQTGLSADAGTRVFVARVNAAALQTAWPFECDSDALPLWFSRRSATAALDPTKRPGAALAACIANQTQTAAFNPRLIARSGKSVRQALAYRLDLLREMLEPLRRDVATVFDGCEPRVPGSGSTACTPCANLPSKAQAGRRSN